MFLSKRKLFSKQKKTRKLSFSLFTTLLMFTMQILMINFHNDIHSNFLALVKLKSALRRRFSQQRMPASGFRLLASLILQFRWVWKQTSSTLAWSSPRPRGENTLRNANAQFRNLWRLTTIWNAGSSCVLSCKKKKLKLAYTILK